MPAPMFVFWFAVALIALAVYPQQAVWLVGLYLWIRLSRGRWTDLRAGGGDYSMAVDGCAAGDSDWPRKHSTP